MALPRDLALALAALLLPAPWPVLGPLISLVLHVGRATALGIWLLAASALLPPARAPAAPPGHAVRLTGHWRERPRSLAGLETDAGRVVLELAADVAPPEPGAALVVLARARSRGGWDAVHVEAAPGATGPAGAWPERLAEVASRRLAALSEGPRRALLASLLLGDRDDLDGPTGRAFADTGTAHVLSVSGMHVTLLSAVARPMLGPWLVGAWLVLFTAVAGPQAPLLRALAMAALAAALARRGVRDGGLAALGLVALIVGAVAGPALMHTLSARLSFLAVGGLMGGAGLCRGRWRWLAGLAAPAGAVLATAPLCGATFGQVTLAGIVVTPLLSLPVAAILGLGSFVALGGDTLRPLDGFTGPLLDGLAGLVLFIVHGAAGILPAPLHPGPPPADPTLLGLGVVLALHVLAPRDAGARP